MDHHKVNATTSLIQRLRTHDESFVSLQLELSNHLGESFPELLEALSRHQTLKSLQLHLKMNLCMNGELHSLFTALGSIINLRTLRLQYSESNNSNNINNFDQVLKSMCSCFLLSNCKLEDFSLSFATEQSDNGGDSGNMQVDLNDPGLLGRALAAVPTLKKVTIQRVYIPLESLFEQYAPNHVTTSSCSSLQSLRIWNCSISRENCQRLAEALSYNSTLQKLDMSRCCLCDDSVVAFSNMLRTNKTLKELHLYVNISDKGCIALAKALETNQTMEHLSVHNQAIDGMTTKVGYNALNRMLERNCYLKHLYWYHYRDKHFCQTYIPEIGKEFQSKRALYLKLNRGGRRRFLQKHPTDNANGLAQEQWVQLLISQRRDLDCIFYFISESPSFCCSQSRESGHTKTKHKRRRLY